MVDGNLLLGQHGIQTGPVRIMQEDLPPVECNGADKCRKGNRGVIHRVRREDTATTALTAVVTATVALTVEDIATADIVAEDLTEAIMEAPEVVVLAVVVHMEEGLVVAVADTVVVEEEEDDKEINCPNRVTQITLFWAV